MIRNKDILKEKTQFSLSTVLLKYHECEHCHAVYIDHNQSCIGMACKECGKGNTEGLRRYFNDAVWSLINLMQEFYHKDKSIVKAKQDNKNQNSSHLAVVLFFLSLREVLLKQFLRKMMIAHGLTVAVSERLFDDNQNHQQMINNLFPALTGGFKWKKSLEHVKDKLSFIAEEFNDFLKDVAKARNDFLHDGRKSAISSAMAKECMLSIKKLLELYVALHNEFVVKQYQNTPARKCQPSENE